MKDPKGWPASGKAVKTKSKSMTTVIPKNGGSVKAMSYTKTTKKGK